MRHALKSQVRADREEGFTLVEILVAMLLMAIIMSSIAVFFIGSTKASTALRVRQSAAVVANDAMDFVHSIKVDQLLIGRDKASSDSQWAAGVVGVDLSTMTELYDTTVPAPANGAGASATLPTTKVASTVNKTPFSTSYFIGKCYVPSGGGDCTKTGTATAVALDRVIVAVNWTDKGSTCPAHTCAYVIATLISPNGDPTFDVHQVIVDTTPPTTPSSLTCTTPSTAAAHGDISIQQIGWGASSDASGIAEYDIYLGTTEPFVKTAATWTLLATSPTTSSSYVATGLTPSTTYYFAVLAKDTAGNVSGPQVPTGTVDVPEPPFLASCSTLPDTVAPTAPTVSATGATTTTTSFSWTGATDDYKLGGYQVFRTGTSLPIATLPSTASTYTDTGLVNGVTYTYTVKAVDAAGNISPASNAVAILTKDTTAPTVPTGLTAVVNAADQTRINVAWTPSTDNVAVTGYQVCRSTSSSFPSGSSTVCATTGTTSYQATGLVATTKYYFEVRAYDAAANYSAYSSYATPLTALTTLTSTSHTDTTVAVSWGLSTDVGVTGYALFVDGSSTPILVGQTTSAYTVTGLTADKVHTFTVEVHDGAGNYSASSNLVSVTTLPSAVNPLTSTGQTTTTVGLSWPLSADAGVTGYAIYVDGSSTPIKVSQTTSAYTVTGLTSGTAHSFTVAAYNAAGSYSALSNVATATTTAVSPCSATNLALGRTATASSNENGSYTPGLAFDGNAGTRWSSAYSDPQWLEVDLGSKQNICEVVLQWETAAGQAFQIQTSNNGTTWTSAWSTTTGTGGTQTILLTGVKARYVRMYGTARTTGYGYSLYEFSVYGP